MTDIRVSVEVVASRLVWNLPCSNCGRDDSETLYLVRFLFTASGNKYSYFTIAILISFVFETCTWGGLQLPYEPTKTK
jgi:hypothetical protein